MKAVIADPEALRSLAPSDVAAYLRANQWRQAAVREGVAATWTRVAECGEFEVEQRLDSEVGDYALRTSEVLRTLAVAEGRSALEIYRDIVEVGDDILRVPLAPPGAEYGTVPLATAAVATARLRELAEAAACAVVDRRAVFGPRKPAQVTDYLDSVSLGQTEVGSYVLTVLSPLPRLQQLVLPAMADPAPPFGRQAMWRLALSLEALRTAAATAAARAIEEPFEQAIEQGVSANLCQAVSALAKAAGGRLEARFTWGCAWPTDEPAIRRVVLSAAAAEMAGEAARWLRERAPRPDFELEGAVVRLARPEEAVQGTVTVRAPVEGQWRGIQLSLGDDDLAVEVRAFETRALFGAVGELVRERGGYVLSHPRDVHEFSDA